MSIWTAVATDLTLAEAEHLAKAIEERAAGVGAVSIDETDESRGLWRVTAFFAVQHEALTSLHLAPQLVARPVASIDWVRRSLEGLAPVVAGRFYVHGSHDRHRRRTGGISIEINAATAFGTGHHGTTWGCLVALDRILKYHRPRHVLDLGCGTALLAIAAARSGVHSVIAGDIDEEAIKASQFNMLQNGMRGRVRLYCCAGLRHRAIRAAAPYDLVFANILARPLVALARELSLAIIPGGSLILSGITPEQDRWLTATYRNHGFIRQSIIRAGNWTTLVLKRKRPARSRAV